LGGLPRFSQRCRLTAGVALQQLGVPYRYGGASTSGFDCIGLVQYSYRAAAKSLQRTIGQLWSATLAIGRNDMQKGDLLFFSIEGKMSHVWMYLGGECFVYVPSSGR
jgi:cell wall-associated NlpC family hydrolase